MRIRTILATGFVLVTAAWAEDHADRENLLGTWQVDEGTNQETWLLESKGDVLQVARMEDGKPTLDLTCKPNGSDCKGTDEGKKVSVTMYFNGPALVQMETKDSFVTKRKFSLDGGTDRMVIDINPVTGPGKHSVLRLRRHLQAASR